MSIAKIANGTLFKIGDGASPEIFTTIPECMKIAGPNIKFDLLDVTSHDSAGFFKEYIPGLADGDVVTTDINWRPSNTIHILLRTNQYGRVLTDFLVVFPDTPDNTVSLTAYVQTMTPTADIGKPLLATVGTKITGEPTWS